jgi:hypothetical protein
MPSESVPERYHDILISVTLGHLTTLDGHRRPQVDPVRFLTQ